MNKFSLTVLIVVVAIGYLLYQNEQLTKKNDELNQQKQTALQQKQSTEQTIANKSICRKDSQQFYEGKKKEEVPEGDVVYSVMDNQTFGFNQKLKTCLIAWEDSKFFRLNKQSFEVHIRHITDVYSNNDVYSWWQRSIYPFDKVEDKLGNSIEYNQQLQYYGLE